MTVQSTTCGYSTVCFVVLVVVVVVESENKSLISWCRVRLIWP